MAEKFFILIDKISLFCAYVGLALCKLFDLCSFLVIGIHSL